MATLRWPYRSLGAQEAARRRAEEAEKSETSPESDEESEGESCNLSDGRVNDEEGESAAERSMPASPAASEASQADAENDTSEDAETVFSENSMASRRAKMFVLGAAGPVTSGETGRVKAPTRKRLRQAWAHINKLKADYISALSQSFGNFDRVVAAGWLVADLMGYAVLERADAYALGCKVRYEAGVAEKNEVSTKKEVSRLKGGDPQRLELQKKLESLMDEVAELPLPVATRMTATGKRKRAREEEPDEHDEHDEFRARSAEEIWEAEKIVRKAEAELARLVVKREQAFAALKRVNSRFDSLKDGEHLEWMGARDKVGDAYHYAHEDEKDAHIELLEAKLEVSELKKGVAEAEWENAMKLCDTFERMHDRVAKQLQTLLGAAQN